MRNLWKMLSSGNLILTSFFFFLIFGTLWISATRTEMGEKCILECMFSAQIQLQHQIWMRQQSRTITFYSWMLLRSKGRKCTIQPQRFPVFEATTYFLLLSATCTTVCYKKLLPHPLYPCIVLVYAILLRYLWNNQRKFETKLSIMLHIES